MAVEKRVTLRVIKSAKQDRMKSGLEHPNRFAKRSRMEAKERPTEEKEKGGRRELHLMAIAREI